MLALFLPALALAGPHADQMAQYGGLQAAPRPAIARAPAPLPPPSVGPDMMVYGYLAYWDNDLSTLPWDELSHLAVFAAEATPSGELTQTSRWDEAADAVAIAQSYGVKVHLCVINFDRTELEQLLGSASARSSLIAELAAWKTSTGADGINVDFENLPGSRRAEMVTFVQDLEAAVGEVVLATPSVDWSDAWDYATLSAHADLFIMGYGYHWSGASYAGPMDPLYAGSGTVWSGVNSFSLSWSLNDYLSLGADPDRVILGLPFYGMSWPTATDGVPSAALASGSSVVFTEAWSRAAADGSALDADSRSYHTYDGASQTWFGDVDTVQERIVYARDVEGVGGIGFWALHYDDDDPAMWAMIHDETTWSTPGTPTDPGTTTEPSTTDPTDTGTEPTETDLSTGTDGTDTTPNTVPQLSAPLQPREAGGCGCTTPAASSPLAALPWLALSALSRRR